MDPRDRVRHATTYEEFVESIVASRPDVRSFIGEENMGLPGAPELAKAAKWMLRSTEQIMLADAAQHFNHPGAMSREEIERAIEFGQGGAMILRKLARRSQAALEFLRIRGMEDGPARTEATRNAVDRYPELASGLIDSMKGGDPMEAKGEGIPEPVKRAMKEMFGIDLDGSDVIILGGVDQPSDRERREHRAQR